MFQAVRRYLTGPEPVVCYQGAARRRSGERRVPAATCRSRSSWRARRSARSRTAGHGLNCYVDDELYVARAHAGGRAVRERSSTSSCTSSARCSTGSNGRRRSSSSSAIPSGSTRSGQSCARSSTGGSSSRSRFRSSSSSRTPTCRRARGSSSSPTASASRRERTVAFGDGENDLELIDWAGYAVAVGNAHPLVKARANFVVPAPRKKKVSRR